ncbi:universal stress protein [Solidesulfovibrio sp.]
MKKVLACIDGSAAAPAVCDYAAWASLRLATPVTLLHVLDDSVYPTQTNLSGNIGFDAQDTLLQELAELDAKRSKLGLERGRRMLQVAAERITLQGVHTVERRQRHGVLLDTLLAMQSATRLLVMGKKGEDGDRLGDHIGNQVENVVRTMHRPVLVTTPEFKTPERILLAFDGSATTRKAVEMVASSPLFRGVPCHLATVGANVPEARTQLEWAQKTLTARGFEAPGQVLTGDVETVLCQYVVGNRIDMLVMGAYGHSRIRQFFIGSTTANMVRNADVPVLLLR